MHAKKYPFAVRLIGFSPDRAAELAQLLAQAPLRGPAFTCLLDDSLQEPDLFIASGDDLKKLATLNPTEAQPALIVGDAVVDLPFPRLSYPLDGAALHATLAELVARRADTLSLITARGWPSISERRRRPRLDFDLTDPAEYAKMRRAQPLGAVLIIDTGGALRDHVARLFATRQLQVEWTDSAAAAVRLCEETAISAVLVNVATPRVDPYALCRQIKALPNGSKVAVVFLVSEGWPYDSARARAAGVRGLLDKPVADRHIVGTLQKLLSLPM